MWCTHLHTPHMCRYQLIRTRVVQLIDNWIGIKMSPEFRPSLYQTYIQLLDPGQPLLVSSHPYTGQDHTTWISAHFSLFEFHLSFHFSPISGFKCSPIFRFYIPVESHFRSHFSPIFRSHLRYCTLSFYSGFSSINLRSCSETVYTNFVYFVYSQTWLQSHCLQHQPLYNNMHGRNGFNGLCTKCPGYNNNLVITAHFSGTKGVVVNKFDCIL